MVGVDHHSNQLANAERPLTELDRTDNRNTLPSAHGLKSKSVETLPIYKEEDDAAPKYEEKEEEPAPI